MKDILHDVGYFQEDRGVLFILGEKRREFLQNLTTNEVTQHFEAAFLTRLGKLIAYASFYEVKNAYIIVTDISRIVPLTTYLQTHAKLMKTTVLNKSHEFSVFSVIGSRAGEWVEKYIGEVRNVTENNGMIIAKYDCGYRLISSEENDWHGVAQLLPEEQELFRIVHGIPKWGIDMDEKTTFSDLGLEHAVSYTKGCYVGQEIVARVKHLGKPPRLLRQLVIDDETAPSFRTPITADNKQIGYITCAIYSSCHQKVIALGYVQKGYYDQGTDVQVQGKRAVVRELPTL